MIAEGELAMRPCTHTSSKKMRRAVLFMWLLMGFTLAVFSSSQAFAAPESDNFDDNIKDNTKWGTDQVKVGGHLDETGGHLEYTCRSVPRSSSDRPWVLRQFPYDTNWWIQIDATNYTYPSVNQWSSFGINVRHVLGTSNKETENEIEVELAAFEQSMTREFYAEFHHKGIYWDAVQGTPDFSAPIRLDFNATTKVFTVSYDADPGPNEQWITFGTFGVGSSGGGSNGNADWSLTGADKFVAYVFGYAEHMSVDNGQLYGDNFKEDGGVPWTGPFIGPTGSFRFAFPANSPLLPIIASITGHYSGVYPPPAWAGLLKVLGIRRYEMDIAQDESGKLFYMGTMEGVTTRDNNSQLSGALGAVSTVNGKPTAKIKGSFDHNIDGKPGKSGGTANIPVEVIKIAGIDSVAGIASYNGKIDGVPFSDKNVPFQVDAPLGTVENLKKDWTLQLDFATKQPPKGKSYIVASAQLVLPNGDTIVFPEKRTVYNKNTGYTVSFSRGTNTTAQKIDTKTSILIKGMTLEKQGAVWQPTAGTLTYKFFGQKGTGNLMEFVAP
jgi:hypothetical protein